MEGSALLAHKKRAGPALRRPVTVTMLSELARGDVVLARLGKRLWYPAIVQFVDVSSASVLFFGDNKQGHCSRTRLRPYADLPTLPASARGNGQVWNDAIAAADAWIAKYPPASAIQHNGGSTPDDDDGWSINGTVVSRAAFCRAAALQLPPIGQPIKSATMPRASFRVVPMAPNAGGATSGDDDEQADDEDDGSSDEAYALRHAPLEDLEYRGFAAHPSVAAHADDHDHDGSASESTGSGRRDRSSGADPAQRARACHRCVLTTRAGLLWGPWGSSRRT